MNRKKLGIMGGTFDPIHNGHLATVEFVRKKLGLEKVLFIPAYVAPHKIGGEFAPADERYKMTELAINSNPYLELSDMELRRQGVSYTYDTVVALQEQYGSEYELFFIIGADSVAELASWHRVREIMQVCTFVAATRPGFALTVDKVIETFGDLGEKRILWVDTPEVDISSTEIRERVKKGHSIKELVPKAVAEYIQQKDLYRR
jgi:nicotinate-nucleotide adenylyltransferase